MTKSLFFSAIFKFLLGVVLVGLLVFIPAGTYKFFNGWLFMGILFIPMLLAGIVMMIKNPKLLEARLDGKEKQKEQGILIKLSGLMFIAGFIVAGLDYRFSWLIIPEWIPYAASGLFLLSYIMWAEVLRENTYLARTIKVEEGQKVIDTGLYGVVRHPMYSATLILFLSIPLILGSLLSFVIMLVYIPIITVRMNNEEKVLEKGLEGYKEYKNRVRYKVIPLVW